MEPCKEEPGGFIPQVDFLFKSASDKPSLLSKEQLMLLLDPQEPTVTEPDHQPFLSPPPPLESSIFQVCVGTYQEVRTVPRVGERRKLALSFLIL